MKEIMNRGQTPVRLTVAEEEVYYNSEWYRKKAIARRQDLIDRGVIEFADDDWRAPKVVVKH